MLDFPLLQDHNIDFIVKFPDWNPSINSGSRTSKLNSMHTYRSRTRSRRFSFQEHSSDLPKAHLWYSTHEVVNALKLFLAAGNDLAGSLTYRLLFFFFIFRYNNLKAKEIKAASDREG